MSTRSDDDRVVLRPASCVLPTQVMSTTSTRCALRVEWATPRILSPHPTHMESKHSMPPPKWQVRACSTRIPPSPPTRANVDSTPKPVQSQLSIRILHGHARGNTGGACIISQRRSPSVSPPTRRDNLPVNLLTRLQRRPRDPRQVGRIVGACVATGPGTDD